MKKKYFYIFSLGLVLFPLRAQYIKFSPINYSVNTLYDGKNGILTDCDPNGRMQDSLIFYTIQKKSLDTLILFRSSIYNDCLKGTSQWFNENGETIGEMTTGMGGCTVHPSYHYFIMPGDVKIGLSALIDKYTCWYTDEATIKCKEEFYHEGDLEKRIKYYKNGARKSEYNFIPDNNINSLMSLYSNDDNLGSKMFGPCTLYYDNGQIESVGPMDGNMQTGAWEYYQIDGTKYMEKTNYQKNSATIEYFYPSGKRKSIYSIFNYLKIGREQEFYESGPIKSYTHYNQLGEQDSAKISLYESGKIMEYEPCCGYNANGIFTHWYENGIRQEEVKLEDGYKKGTYFSWHPNGKIQSKGNYGEYEKKIGKWYFYNDQGKLDHITNFDIEPEVYEDVEVITQTEVFSTEDKYNYKIAYFSRELPVGDLFYKHLPATKENGLGFTKKYQSINLRIEVDTTGKAEYYILTPMKKKHRELLQELFNQYPIFYTPYTIMGNPVPSTIMVEINYFSK